ncbi:MAG: RNase adapter RapZ [Bryobacteraceae bacterium]
MSGLLLFEEALRLSIMAKSQMAPAPASKPSDPSPSPDLVIITGLSGSGKATVLKAFEDLGYYAVDNLPITLVPKFAGLTHDSKGARKAALTIDVREGEALKDFPAMYKALKKQVSATLLFLDADDNVLQRRYSETRRPHPLGTESTVLSSIQDERAALASIQPLADLSINTSKLNVHELRSLINEKFEGTKEAGKIVVHVNSFGFRNGVPPDSDLVFDVRFLPNPNYIPEFKKLSGRHPSVARYIRSYPQTIEFMNRISDLLIYLLPHYIREGKSYLTISFGCTGGQHRSVMIANEIRKRLAKAGYSVKESHRDMHRS